MSHKNIWKSREIVWGQPPSAVQPSQAQRRGNRLVSMVGGSLLAVLLGLTAMAQKPAPKPTEGLPAGVMQMKATTACLECHDARIILQQRLSKAAWTREVDKMMKWGAIVEANDRDALIDYFSANFGPDQPAYEPPRSAKMTK